MTRKQGWKRGAERVAAMLLAVLMPGLLAAAPLKDIPFQQLPREAKATYRLILKGGPFPYQKDGSVFQNREKLLPIKPRNHYREYTVSTPGVDSRGARRMVCGLAMDCYYTADHYRSFRRIVK